MDPEESKISVWVSGLTTTCTDVVKVPQEERKTAGLSSCVVQTWGGLRSIIPDNTQVLRLRSARGEQRDDFRFLLLRHDAPLQSDAVRSAEARVVLSQAGPCVPRGFPGATGGPAADRQRRLIREAFTKMEKMNRKRAQVASRNTADKMETLVHLVISQDHTIGQQIHRIKDLDAEIERCETNVHSDRMKRHGLNYVQDTYLTDGVHDGPSRRGGGGEQFLSQRCEEVLKLQEELMEPQVLVDSMAVEIQEEPNQRWMTDRLQLEAEQSVDNQLLQDGDRIRTQLDTRLYTGLRLDTGVEATRSGLKLTREIVGTKGREVRDLLEKVNTLDVGLEDGAAHGHDGTAETGMMCTSLELKGERVERARGLSTTCDADDEDSGRVAYTVRVQISGLCVHQSPVQDVN
ncbi:ras association domain-containing protein 10 [Lampris incognitus]|uniref:ras association domain-containing protein 10 n=1 Tax=Lampris incognitus TaxID=2546036 RepID=UPI0024B5B259|nr:ras association domain-containing protein 10 [Lampris incognitus]